MTFTEQFLRWNQWYDGMPPDRRYHYVLWPLVALGALNLSLTIAAGFPFALLVLLGIAALAVIRVPYAYGWISGTEHGASGASDLNWLIDLNRRYDAMPESRRFWIFPAILVVAGAINMALTISNGFSFGLLFLLALLVLVLIRAPYAYGMLNAGETSHTGPAEPAPAAAITSDQPASLNATMSPYTTVDARTNQVE